MSDAPKDSTAPDKRSGRDRRQNKIPRLKYLLAGQRKKFRREEDRYKTFVFDRYSTRIFAAIMSIICLSLLDALLTLYLIAAGAFELNPVMAYFLTHGPMAFLGAKYFLTSFAVVILLIFKNVIFSKPKIHARSLLHYVMIAFTTVIGWELYLIFVVLP
ncbi:MAG: hypothetical protein JSW39_23135 [Desulfobacterales bacterium]|nr:MAG: hypothetical protein JSW39_23135 [Desulfobacterales bacterium]